MLRAQIARAQEHTLELQQVASEQQASARALRGTHKKARADCAELSVATASAAQILDALRTVHNTVQAEVLDRSRHELDRARAVRDDLRVRFEAAMVAAQRFDHSPANSRLAWPSKRDRVAQCAGAGYGC